MSNPTTDLTAAVERMLLGDEAVALGALHAGISAAYAYPGTPSTEIFECLLQRTQGDERVHANWCTNEKTALEAALGVSQWNRRALVSMKHVGLNVAADPFMNAAMVTIHGGLVLAVADDPGMHSSQNEQDTRIFADFARIICLEPSTQQEAYDMTREAFDLSERFHIPVIVRLVTRLCHSRTAVQVGERRPPNELRKTDRPMDWILVPLNARRVWHDHLGRQAEMRAYSEQCRWNELRLAADDGGLGVITTGLARNYFLENAGELAQLPSHLHIGAYPFPADKIRELCANVQRVLVLEEGYPYVERQLRGILPTPVAVLGKEDGTVPLEGELDPDHVRKALGLPARARVALPGLQLPGRPPQLCNGCPHRDSFAAINEVTRQFARYSVMSDVGCYALGALPPFNAVESCVCMGSSIGMAKGAADVGQFPALAVIGDSTFLHSGVTPLMDAVSANTNMVVLILDNEVVAMTGAQPTVLPPSRLASVVLGVGVAPERFRRIEAHPKRIHEMAQVIREELDKPGLSVIIIERRCVVAASKDKKHRQPEVQS